VVADRRLAHGVLAVTGSMLSHSVAYGLLSTGVGFTGHGATDTVFATLMSLLFTLVGVVVVRAAVGNGSVVTITVGRLALLQAGLFAAQEMVESIGSGDSLAHALTATPVLVGFLIQPLVALALLMLVRHAERLGAGIAARPAPNPPTGPAQLWRPISSAVPLRVDSGNQFGSRAPPR
jgi:hypothetical protein